MHPREPREPSEPRIASGGGVPPGGESFTGGGYAGGASFTLPIPLPDARGFAPHLALDYVSGAPNGPFGLGFRLGLPSVSRAVQLRTPSYTLGDTFVCDEGVLVHVTELDRVEDGMRVLRYAPRVESSFSLIEQYVAEQTGETHWRIVDREGTVAVLGRTPGARIADPSDPARVFSWLIEESTDRYGNAIAYTYKPEDLAGVSSPDEHGCGVNLYPKTIAYGAYAGAGGERLFAFRIVFDYGEETSAGGSWALRADPFSNYQPRFDLRTRRLCRAVLIHHDLPAELGAPSTLVAALRLRYDERPRGSTLAEAVHWGYASYANGGDAAEHLPPIAFEYTPFDAARAAFVPLRVTPAPLGTQLSSDLVQFVDLEGQGLPSLLYGDPSTTLVWEPQGDGTYTGPAIAPEFPGQRDLQDPAYAIADLDADGRLELVVSDGQAGYYPYAGGGAWGTFEPFAGSPTTLRSPAMQQVELHGNGRTDRALFTTTAATVYASKGTDGFAAPVVHALPAGFPPGPGDLPQAAVRFASVFGDGLDHRIVVGSGFAKSWPNLGDGTFGEPVRIANAPQFGESFDPARLFFADLTGDGFADLIYAGAGRLTICFNQSGNAFGEPLSVPLPVPFDRTAALRFADVRGTGVTAAVLIVTDPQIGGYQLDFRLEQRPDLLCGVDNHRGLSTRVRYAASTAFYLADRRAGKPWATRMYFPVAVVEKIETWDAIARAKTAERFAYHDGYYDSAQREFRGFGYVEHWDSETFETFVQPDLHPAAALLAANEPVLFTTPAYTRSWYHNGAYGAQGAVALQYAAEYWQGDPSALRLPESVIESGEHTDARTLIEGTAALAGELLREETYGLDGAPGDTIPYTVTEHDYTARLLHPHALGRYCVFAVFPRETVTSNYDRIAGDPRIEHDATLEIDAYGNVTSAVRIAYGRRDVAARVAEQIAFRATSRSDSFVNLTNGAYLVGLPVAVREDELLGLDLEGRRYFTYAMLRAQVPLSAQHDARLLMWEISSYWNAAQTAALPEGEATPRGLLHHTASALFSDALVQDVFNAGTTRVSAEQLRTLGGYVLDRSYWWNPGDIRVHRDAASFFALSATIDPFGGSTAYAYDPYELLVVRVTDALGNAVTIANDYRTLLPRRIVDVNDVASEALFTPLGYVLAHAIYGTTDGKPDGDLPLSQYAVRPSPTASEAIEDPHHYLQGATTYYCYDLGSWDARGEPLHALEVQRTLHVSALPAGEHSPVRLHLLYLDGEGRHVQEQLQVPLDVTTEPVDPDATQLWQTTGAVVYDNKGQAVREYRPYFSSYASAADVRYAAPASGTPVETTRFDALSREIEVVDPSGFFRRTVYAAWSQWDYDEDDTVAESPLYRSRICDTDPAFAAERDALIKAAAFADTPVESVLDPLANVCRTVETNVIVLGVKDECGNIGPGQNPIVVTRTLVPLTTYRALDVQGNVVSLTDPRLAAWNETHGTAYRNFRYVRAMDGEALLTESADAGPLLALNDASGNRIMSWDGRGTASVWAYDLMGRLESLTVTMQGPHGAVSAVVDAIEYGTDRAKNQNERPVVDRDEAGRSEFALYDVEGQPLTVRRTLLAQADARVDWRAPETMVLEDVSYTQTFVYDALQRVLQATNADGTTQHTAYYPPGWIASLTALRADGTALASAPAHRYDARGLPLLVRFANGTETTRTFDAASPRLKALRTARTSDQRVFQDLAYTYDPVGNVTRIADASLAHIVEGAPGAPLEYTYDALYQLVRATGREADAQAGYAPYVETYAYDAGRNLVTTVHAGATSWQRDFTVAPDSDRSVPSGMLGSGDTPNDFYDGDGNLTAYEALGELAWDYRNALARAVVGPAGSAASEHYLYDAAGRRLRKVFTSGDTSTSRTYAGGLILLTETSAAAEQQRTVIPLNGKDGAPVALATEPGPQTPAVRYQYAATAGSIAVELDASGELVTYQEFHPYGTSALTIASQPSWAATKIYRYGGREHDEATSFAYYGARYYPGSFGRWPSADPAGPQGNDLDLYEFVRNNPVTLVDVGGLLPARRKRKKKKFDLRVVQRKSGLGLSVKVEGRPKKFTTYTLKAVSKKFPSFHRKGTTQLVGNNKYSRNHEFPWFGIAKEIRTDTRGMSQNQLENYIKNYDTSKFKQVRYKNQLSRIQKTQTLTGASVKRALMLILLERFNDPDNLYVGSSSVNSSGGSSMKQKHVKLKNNHNGTAVLAPKQVITEQKAFMQAAVDARPGSSAQRQAELIDRHEHTWGKTPGKYIA